MDWPLVKLKAVAPAVPIKHEIHDNFWLLNLDQIESDTGTILQKTIVASSSIGTSTHGFDERHVLYSKLRPYLNKVALPDGKGVATTELVPMLPDPERLDRSYLAYYLRSKHFVDWVSTQVAGAKMPRVSMQRFWQHEIPLPPLEEQKRIAAILDKADTIRRKRQQAIQLTDDFLRSVFLDMFGDPVANPKGWEVRELRQLTHSFQNGIGKGKKYYGRGTKIANISDLYEAADFIPEKYSLLETNEKENEKYHLSKGDLLFVRSSVKKEGVAFCSVYNSDELCLFSSFMIRAKIKSEIAIPTFLAVQLRTPSQREQLINAANTATITNISQDGLSEIKVIVPPIQLQNDFIKIQNKVKQNLAKNKKLEYENKSLFSSLSQKAFRGEL